MVDLSPEQLDALVEIANERLDALARAEVPSPRVPTKTVWYVRSDITGAIVGTHEGEHAERSASAEARRMNDEARAGNVRHEGKPMTYRESGPAEVTDEQAQLEVVIEQLTSARDDAADDDARAAIDAGLVQRETELAMVRDGTLEARRAEASEADEVIDDA